jgi:hypothetical protein
VRSDPYPHISALHTSTSSDCGSQARSNLLKQPHHGLQTRARKTLRFAASTLCAAAIFGFGHNATAQEPAKPAPAKAVPRRPIAKNPNAGKPRANAPTSKRAAPKAAGTKTGGTAPNAPCPPGAFCEEATAAPPPPVAKAPKAEPAATKTVPLEPRDAGSVTVVLPPPPQDRDPNKPRVFVYRPDPRGGPGEVVIYEDGIVTLPRPKRPPMRRKRRRRKKRKRFNQRFALGLRIQGALMPRNRVDAEAGGMGGAGVSFRYRPFKHFALEAGIDFLAGTDSNGFERQEVPLSGSGLFYVNPKDWAQFYFQAGVNGSLARVQASETRSNLAEGDRDAYNYFGGHAGVGIEFRVHRNIGIQLDGLIFARTRTDPGKKSYPEFYNADTGEISNSSAAGLVRAGINFWW